ncbi:MAG: hypothetical protein SH847_23875 [Roseiflexaceae bacterium]|nr:hypothetical protein [Roseiflexaceae bacterium]
MTTELLHQRQYARNASTTISNLERTAVAGVTLGWLPALSVCSALALLLVAYADTLARTGSSWAITLFWIGLLLLLVPCAARLCAANAARSERIGLVVLVGMGLYAIKILHSPLAFTFPDELQHWRTINNILDQGHLFSWNPILPISPLYPGLENATSAIISLSGLAIFPAGVVLIGVVRLVLMLSLYLLFEHLGRSPRLAAIGALLYVATPNFVFLMSLFAYQSLALPLMVLLIYAASARQQCADCDRIGLNLIVLLCAGAVATTHHVTMFVLLSFLALWTILAAIVERSRTAGPSGTFALALVAGLGWVVYLATLTVIYIGSHLWNASAEFQQIFAGGMRRRQLFQSASGSSAAAIEQLLGFAAVILITIGILYGVWQIWLRYRHNALILTLAIAALAYPATLPMRLTLNGIAVVGRVPEFLFIGISFVLAIAVETLGRDKRLWLKVPLFCTYTAVIVAGGIAVGWPPPSSRLPGPYRVEADTRSIELQGVSAAKWMHASLQPGNRIIADWINGHLAAAYGDQLVITSSTEGLNIAMVVLNPTIDADVRYILKRAQVRYVVTDQRLTQELPQTGFYFDGVEPGAFQHTELLSHGALDKFDSADRASRIFDSGDIRIYDVRNISDDQDAQKGR